MTFPDQERQQKPAFSCTWACYERAVQYHLSRGQMVTQWGSGYTFLGRILSPEAAWRANRIHVEHLVVAGRYEDAAMLYEKLGMWKEAGDLRSRGRQQYITQVHVNVNDLVQQLRAMGVSASYTCPVCRSPSTITGTTFPDALAKCQYFGAVARPTDVVETITKVLGSR